MAKFTAAAIQRASTGDIGENLQQAGALLEEAAKRGAALAALPADAHRHVCRVRLTGRYAMNAATLTAVEQECFVIGFFRNFRSMKGDHISITS